jgi:hypothetical protein
VETPGSYRLSSAALLALPAHVIAQADPSEAALAERLLGQLASLRVHSQRAGAECPLSFRPAPATAALAARALAALSETEPETRSRAAA